MKCTRLVCMVAMVVLLMAAGQVMATPVSQNFNGLVKIGYTPDSTWNGFRLSNTLCDTIKAYGGTGRTVRLRNSATPNQSFIEYHGADSLGKDGGVGTFSFIWRGWNASAVTYKVAVQVDGGAYDTVGTLSSTDTSQFYTFSYALNNSSDNIRIKIVRISGERLMVDNFEIADYSGGGDVTPPSISSISIISTTALDVLFSEPVDAATAEIEGNYVVTPGSSSPSLATRDGTDTALVHLTFASALPTGMDTLTVNAVEDTAGNACTNATAYFQLVVAGDIRITEVMYDDTASLLNPDSEWVEIHNTTGSVISLAGWYLTDDDTYPVSTEGALTIPAGTTIPANGYLVLAKADLGELTGEIVCTQSGSFALNNGGDNLALYTAASGGTLIDGSPAVDYPDLSTPGYSIEKCDEHAAWDGSASAWHMSSNLFGIGRYLYCTPGAANTICVDLTPPGIASLSVISSTLLDVLWDEPVDLTTAETEANYVVTPGGATPSSALLDGGNIFLVHLTFAAALPQGTDTLTVNAVEDTSSNNNACVNEWRTFVIPSPDVTPPGITSVTPLSKTALDVLFTEPVDLTTAETEANYTVLPGSIVPNSALRDATNLALVHLTFALNLPAGADTLNVNAVEDTTSNNNACSNVQKTFHIPLADAGDVVINEVMYDDTAVVDTEWVEIHNRTASPVDVSGWVLIDAPVYPVAAVEGGIQIPASTSIVAYGYLVLSKVDLPDVTGEVVCTEYHGSWALNNSGDNLALYSDSVGGLLIDGVASADTTLQFADLAAPGTSVEKCNENTTWVGDDSTAWHASTNAFSIGRYQYCTPGDTNSECIVDTFPPTLVSVTVVNNITLDVLFSEPLDQTTAQTAANYSVDLGVGSPATATRQVDQTTVRLVYLRPMWDWDYDLLVNNVEDVAGNPINPGSQMGFTVNPLPYSIIYTEFMPNPNFVSLADSLGEWFEIYNGGESAVDMSGWIIADNAGRDTLEGTPTIASGDYFVFCSKGDSAVNGGVPDDYAYRYATSGWGLSLSNTLDSLTLRDAAGNVVATQKYTTAFHWFAGQSAQLRDLSYNGAMDTSWCIADTTTIWPGAWNGDHGTPGEATICAGAFVPDTIPLCSIRVQDTCGVPTRLYTRWAVRGVISFVDTCKRIAYLQSGGCGVAIYRGPLFNVMRNSTRLPMAGDSVVVDGYVTQFRGLTEIGLWANVVPVITFISAGHTVTPVDIACTDIGLLADSCRGENFESEMVRLLNVSFVNPVGNFPLADSNYAIQCGTDLVYFRVDSCDTALIGTAIPTEQIHITAVLGQYDSVGCACQGYQLLYGGGTPFTSAQCADPESLTVIRDGMTNNIVLRWTPGAGQTCNCYEIYWAADAVTVWPTGYTYLAYVVGSTTYTDNLGTPVRRFYRVIAGGPNCP